MVDPSIDMDAVADSWSMVDHGTGKDAKEDNLNMVDPGTGMVGMDHNPSIMVDRYRVMDMVQSDNLELE